MTITIVKSFIGQALWLFTSLKGKKLKNIVFDAHKPYQGTLTERES
jgi:hypothetical protein